MSHEITLPSGATAVIRDGDDLTYGDREDVFANAPVDPDGGGKVKLAGQGINDFYRILLRIGVASWTVVDKTTGEVLPIPSADDSAVRKLSIRDGAYLNQELMALQKELFPSFDVAPDGSPTTP